jgi:hypothetical protein
MGARTIVNRDAVVGRRAGHSPHPSARTPSARTHLAPRASCIVTSTGAAARPAEVRETHIGVVLLMGERAYKFKKPVDLQFLDFRSREQRDTCCRREVELNRRLAPDVYLGVGQLTVPDVADAEPVVVMRRMPEDRRLSTMLLRHTDIDDAVDRLAHLLAAFHAAADRSPAISAEGSRDAIRGRWFASFDQVAGLGADVLDPAVFAEIRRRVTVFLAGRSALFDRRIEQGRVVDGHGDLICDDIFCLDDGPRILDCLEFDDRLRYIDGLDDVAFLAMDLEMLGAAGSAELLFRKYADLSGDPAPAALRHHFVSYRAFVRAKVEALRSAQGRPGAAADARRYADLALDHLRAGTVRMVLIGGAPGAGKSTVAGQVADDLGSVLLTSDRIRKEISGISPLQHVTGPYRYGLYDAGHTRHTYREMLTRAGKLLALGESVVVDASWNDPRRRAEAAACATASHAELHQVCCSAPPELRRHRLRLRAPGPSDADAVIAARMERDTTPWPDAVTVATTGTVGEAVNTVLGHVRTGANGCAT